MPLVRKIETMDEALKASPVIAELPEHPTATYCLGCKKVMPLSKMNKYHFCPKCAEIPVHQYKNTKWFGESDEKKPFSFEFEVQYSYKHSDKYSFQPLIDAGFLETYDCTVDLEMKSPIYREELPFLYTLPLLEEFKDTVQNNCGTHTHVECRYQDRIHRYEDALFGQLLTHLVERKEETTKVFGRYFQSYCWSSSGSWINAGDAAQPTLEWRLIKFANQYQFRDIVRWARDITAHIDWEMGRWERRSPGALEVIGRYVLESYKRAVA